MNSKTLDIYKKKNIVNLVVDLMVFSIMVFLQYESLLNTINGINPVGKLVVYIQTISKVDSIISDIMNTSFTLYQVTLYIQHLYNYLNMNSEEDFYSGVKIKDVKKTQGNTICFDNIWFSYPKSEKYILENVNFRINQGEIVSIIGKNGSGKSTLLSLLGRLYNCSKGNIFYNDTPINKINLLDWRNELKILSQDFIKYEFTLKQNINISSDNDINYVNKFKKIFRLIEMKKIIDKLPMKEDTQLGMKFEGGIQISQGEWQKVSIARTLFKKGTILFLDEPSSALDINTEKKIFEAVRYMIDEKYIDFAFFITHNYENLKYSNKVLMLNNGENIAFEDYENIKKYFDKNSDAE